MVLVILSRKKIFFRALDGQKPRPENFLRFALPHCTMHFASFGTLFASFVEKWIFIVSFCAFECNKLTLLTLLVCI